MQILNKPDRGALAEARKKARAKGRNVRVQAHDRRCYRINGAAADLARWEKVEAALSSLCKGMDRKRRITQADRRRALALKTLIEDTFNV